MYASKYKWVSYKKSKVWGVYFNDSSAPYGICQNENDANIIAGYLNDHYGYVKQHV